MTPSEKLSVHEVAALLIRYCPLDEQSSFEQAVFDAAGLVTALRGTDGLVGLCWAAMQMDFSDWCNLNNLGKLKASTRLLVATE